MKNILVIDTSDNILKIALQIGGRPYCVSVENTQRHVEILIPKIKQLFDEANADVKSLSEIYVCCGPGSFTGLRIGIATAITLAFSLAIPVYGFCIFSVYDYLVPSRNVLVPLIDGKKKQFYCAFIGKTFCADNTDAFYDLNYDDLLAKLKQDSVTYTFVGKDVELIEAKLRGDGIPFEWLYQNNYTPLELLAYVNHLGGEHNLTYPSPIYIRKSEAELELLNRKK